MLKKLYKFWHMSVQTRSVSVYKKFKIKIRQNIKYKVQSTIQNTKYKNSKIQDAKYRIQKHKIPKFKNYRDIKRINITTI